MDPKHRFYTLAPGEHGCCRCDLARSSVGGGRRRFVVLMHLEGPPMKVVAVSRTLRAGTTESPGREACRDRWGIGRRRRMAPSGPYRSSRTTLVS